jgi:Raf kinase inhibitor-like YbhB/YbcL family protein
MTNLTITSPAFTHEGDIPSRYTCDGESISPELRIQNLPQDAVTLALIVEDPDAPSGTYDHWLVWNIDRTETIAEGANPGISGNNSGGKTGYHPPCPPSGSHRYYFHVYALDTHLDLSSGIRKTELQAAMQSHIIAQGTLMGRYSRSR